MSSSCLKRGVPSCPSTACTEPSMEATWRQAGRQGQGGGPGREAGMANQETALLVKSRGAGEGRGVRAAVGSSRP